MSAPNDGEKLVDQVQRILPCPEGLAELARDATMIVGGVALIHTGVEMVDTAIQWSASPDYNDANGLIYSSSGLVAALVGYTGVRIGTQLLAQNVSNMLSRTHRGQDSFMLPPQTSKRTPGSRLVHDRPASGGYHRSPWSPII